MKSFKALVAILLVVFTTSQVFSQTVIFTVQTLCGNIPMPNIPMGVSGSAISPYSYPIDSGDGSESWSPFGLPNGYYTLNVRGGTLSIPNSSITPYGSGFTWNVSSDNTSVYADFKINKPAAPRFSIGGQGARISPAINLYKCSPTQITVPIINTSTFAYTIKDYRTTVYNSSSTAIVGTQSYQSAWNVSAPPNPEFSAAPAGQFYIVRMEIRNTCNEIESIDALVKWNSNTLPSVNAFSLNDFTNGCVPQTLYFNNAPVLGSNSGGICNPDINASIAISKYRVRCWESDNNGAATGVGVIMDITENATTATIPTTRSFSQLSGGPSWFTNNYSYATAAGRKFIMEFSTYNECGWSNLKYSYFKIKPTCLGCLVSFDDPDFENGSIAEGNQVDLTKVAPNPFGSFVHVFVGTQNTTNISMEWYSLEGRLIEKVTSPYFDTDGVAKIETDHFNAGVYFLKIDVDGATTSHRVIKN